jgi:CRP-like cAMP-binding protein
VSKQLNITRLLADLPLFQQLRDSEIAQLAMESREIKLSKGQILFQKGDLLEGFYVVVEGQIKLAFSSPQGTGKGGLHRRPRRQFRRGGHVHGKNRVPVFTQALEDSHLLYIAKRGIFYSHRT